MIPIHLMIETMEGFPKGRPASFERLDLEGQNLWTLDVLPRSGFEDAHHTLNPVNDNYRPRTSDQCDDIVNAGVIGAAWAFSEKAWDWLPALEASGCRVAHNVDVKRGRKRFKLVYAAPILDLLDHEQSELTWNNGKISWINNIHLHAWAGQPPLMFQLLFHNKIEYRGVTSCPSGRTFVSQAFVDEATRRSLTGVDFHILRRTPRSGNEPADVVVHCPRSPDTTP